MYQIKLIKNIYYLIKNDIKGLIHKKAILFSVDLKWFVQCVA